MSTLAWTDTLILAPLAPSPSPSSSPPCSPAPPLSPVTFTQTRTDPEERAACQVDAVTFKSFMESPVSTDGALTELTNSLQPTQQCMRNITMCGLSAPRR